MVKCLNCNKKRTTNAPPTTRVICWQDYQLCARCCIEKHPYRYPLNVINQFLGKEDRSETDRRYYIKKTTQT